MMTGESSAEDAFDQPTVGVPMPDTEVKLVDVDTGETIAIDEAISAEREGELYLDGPQRMRGSLDTASDPFDDGERSAGSLPGLVPFSTIRFSKMTTI